MKKEYYYKIGDLVKWFSTIKGDCFGIVIKQYNIIDTFDVYWLDSDRKTRYSQPKDKKELSYLPKVSA